MCHAELCIFQARPVSRKVYPEKQPLMRLHSGNGFILQDADNDAPVLRLSFLCLMIADLFALAHRAR